MCVAAVCVFVKVLNMRPGAQTPIVAVVMCCAIFCPMASFGASDLRVLEAARRGDERAVRGLLAAGAPAGTAEADGSTALHIAVHNGSAAITDMLIAAGADPKLATRYNVTPLALAAANGDTVMIERLLRAGAGPNDTSREGQTALMTAALTGKPEAVKLLVRSGADVNSTEPVYGQTALMWAASEGNTEALSLLIEFGANVKARSKAGFTPLLFAVRNGQKPSVQTLLAHGANANDVAPGGTTVLNAAILNASYEIASMLLDNGADPNAPDDRGSALHALAWLRKPGSDGGNGLGQHSYGNPIQVGDMGTLELARRLLEHGANPNAKFHIQEGRVTNDGNTRNPPLIRLGRHYLSFSGATPFYLAARNGDAQYMNLLVEHGADPKATNDLGITPLIVAAGLDYWEGESPGPYTGVSEPERLEAVKLALRLGNDINAAANFGDIPAMDGAPEYLLLYYPLNLAQLQDKITCDPRWNGSTALHAAVVSGQPAIVQYLIDNGADINAKTKSGWTPLLMTTGVFFANSKKDFPAAAEILKRAGAH
jgi:ankyrin repeat protein